MRRPVQTGLEGIAEGGLTVDYKELLKDQDFYSPQEAVDWMNKAEKAIKELLSRAESAEARCATLDKLVKEYQEQLIPGYRERAEKAEQERDAAVSLCGKLVAICDPPKEWRPKLFRPVSRKIGDYMGSGYMFVDSFNRIFDDFVETADDGVYMAVRKAVEAETQKRGPQKED